MIARWLRRRPQLLSSLEAYRHWATHYPPNAHNPLMQAEQAAMLALMPNLRDRVVLDLACGTGRYALIAWEHRAKVVLGLDNSEAMLRANPLSRMAALASTEAIPLGTAAVDVVLCGLAVGHVRVIAPSVAEVGRVLKPGGCALISDLHPFVALNGGQRTFSVNGTTYAVEHHAHLYSDIHAAAAAAGMSVDAVLEPGLDNGSRPPVVIVYRLKRAV